MGRYNKPEEGNAQMLNAPKTISNPKSGAPSLALVHVSTSFPKEKWLPYRGTSSS